MKISLSRDVKEDFWNDCYNFRDTKPVHNKNFTQYYGRNNNASLYKKNPKNYIYMSFEKNNNIIKKKNKSKNKSNNNKTFENVNLSKIYKNHHFIEENIEPIKVDKVLESKKKNAMMRCLGLYAYGVEVKKARILNMSYLEIIKILKMNGIIYMSKYLIIQSIL